MFFQKEDKRAVWGLYPNVLHIHPISVVRAGSVLVLAPHPDDDVIGCGGLLKSLSESGAKIKVIYFTDGSRGNRDLVEDRNLIEKRELESRKAGEILGVSEQRFLRLPHTKMRSSFELSKSLRRELEFDKPDLILAPSVEEPHPDHLAVSEALSNSLRDFDSSVAIWLYEVFATGRINRLFPIDRYLEAKREALSCHKSQFSSRQYEESILLLNQFRARSAGIAGYAEAYYATGPRTYRKLFEIYNRHHESKI